MASTRIRLLGAAGLLVAAVAGFGFWHVSTHAWLFVGVADPSAPGRLPGHATDVVFLDGAARRLASTRVEADGTVRFLDAPSGDCHAAAASPDHPVGAGRWTECIAGQATWLPTWVGAVHAVDVAVAGCPRVSLPVRLTGRRDEAWLWWVPLPHVGGRPYTHYRLGLAVDRGNCRISVD